MMENKKYLDKVIGSLVRGTNIDNDNLTSLPPFLSYIPSYLSTFHSLFNSYCKNTFGLTKEEIDYVWNEYKEIIKDKLENGE